MGNALLDIFSFGRRAGVKAAEGAGRPLERRSGIGHVYDVAASADDRRAAAGREGASAPQPRQFRLAVDAKLGSARVGDAVSQRTTAGAPA